MNARSQGGFTYLGLLFAVALLGIALSAVGIVWSAQIRREKESELLFVGAQIRTAIGRYYSETPSGAHGYPASLQDLLQDPRWPQVHRHLRRLYFDPMTGTQDWQLILAPEGGIMGVATSSMAMPMKRTNFLQADAAFDDAECVCDWQFVYRPFVRGQPLQKPLR